MGGSLCALTAAMMACTVPHTRTACSTPAHVDKMLSTAQFSNQFSSAAAHCNGSADCAAWLHAALGTCRLPARQQRAHLDSGVVLGCEHKIQAGLGVDEQLGRARWYASDVLRVCCGQISDPACHAGIHVHHLLDQQRHRQKQEGCQQPQARGPPVPPCDQHCISRQREAQKTMQSTPGCCCCCSAAAVPEGCVLGWGWVQRGVLAASPLCWEGTAHTAYTGWLLRLQTASNQHAEDSSNTARPAGPAQPQHSSSGADWARRPTAQPRRERTILPE